MIFTTLKKLKNANACSDRFEHLKTALGETYKDDTPINLTTILEHNGLDDTLWVPISALSGDHLQQRYRLLAVACCQDILHLMKDQRSIDAVKISHLYAHGEANKKELTAARDAAIDAWDAAWAAARDVAKAARAVTWDAARDVAWDAAKAARAAARDVAWNAARERQSAHFKVIFSADFEDE